jgi:hypothetical protein
MTARHLVDSSCERARRNNDIHSDFVAIAYAMGSSRKDLQRSGPWYEACRNPKEYEPARPYLREDQMIHDAVTTVANRGTDAERKAVRSAVTQYYETRCRLSLEMLGETDDQCLIALVLDSKKEISEADCAATVAITSKTPESRERAARETTEALTVLERLRNRFYTPRTARIMQVSR